LEALDFDVSLVATEWFLCLFSKSLPSEVRTVLRLSLSLTISAIVQKQLVKIVSITNK
jgi:hypothetical protein